MSSSITSTIRVGTNLPPLKGPGKLLYLIPVVLLAGAALAYYNLVYAPAHTARVSTLQTATARQGELDLSAAGTGTLTAPEDDLGFTAGGGMTVTGVYVKVGDLVNEGDLLAQVDSQQAQLNYEQAKQKYDDLTSATAVAAAARAVANVQSNVQSAKLQLEYLISPDVMYWETEADKSQSTMQEAQAQLAQYPDDETAQKSVKKAQAVLNFDQSKIAEAWQTYKDDYVPATFPLADNNGSDNYLVPTDLEIQQARLAIGKANTKLREVRELYQVLTGNPMPADTSNASLITLQQAKSNLDEAQASLDGTKIVAPFAGIIMQVNATGGDMAEADPKSGGDSVDATSIIVIDDTTHPFLEVYWDESDWDLLKLGTAVEITFDDLPDQVFTGKITEMDSDLYTTGNSTAIRGDVTLDTAYSDLNLPVGASASVQAVSQRAENAIYIPIEALHNLGSDKYAVFVLSNGEPMVRMVKVGIQNEQYAQITSGLEAGDVVTTGIVKTK
jgi:HlyD family secretion protein